MGGFVVGAFRVLVMGFVVFLVVVATATAVVACRLVVVATVLVGAVVGGTPAIPRMGTGVEVVTGGVLELVVVEVPVVVVAVPSGAAEGEDPQAARLTTATVETMIEMRMPA